MNEYLTLRVSSYMLRVTGFKLQVSGCFTPDSYRDRVTGCYRVVTGLLQVTRLQSYRLQSFRLYASRYKLLRALRYGVITGCFRLQNILFARVSRRVPIGHPFSSPCLPFSASPCHINRSKSFLQQANLVP